MKRIELIQPYKILSSNTTKLTKMDDNDKFIFIKFLREVKPIVDELSDAISVAQDKLKGDNHIEIMDKFYKWDVIDDATKLEVSNYLKKYNEDVEKAVHDIAQSGIEIKNTLSEDAFDKFMASNDFDVATIMQLSECLIAK